MEPNDGDEKIPLKLAQISIDKFNQTIPQYLTVLRNHKCNIEKAGSLNDWEKVKREQLNATRIVKQIRFMLVEIDKVRQRLRASDYDRFDEGISSTKKDAFNSMAEYMAMQQSVRAQSARNYQRSQYDEEGGSRDGSSEFPTGGRLAYVPQITSSFNTEEHELRQREECLRQMESLQREMEDIQELYQKVHELVHEQGETVTRVEENVDVAQIQVEAGVTALQKALAYKKAVYPLAGAFLGSCIGGPIGLVVGLKAGGLAALGGGLVGFASGKFIKNVDALPEPDEAGSNDSATEATPGTPTEPGEAEPIASKT
ncbi:AGAP005684-PA [Anopheles gambiae str. PEST]|uniref:AGAP005684-PA n=1 Tax=Anopheles gambiae TaxID=7165 RepID=Q7Q6T2_ANOGA|nr:AGAP005684-PA [Anopheles gambiae str. PEST]